MFFYSYFVYRSTSHLSTCKFIHLSEIRLLEFRVHIFTRPLDIGTKNRSFRQVLIHCRKKNKNKMLAVWKVLIFIDLPVLYKLLRIAKRGR